jgi:N-acetylglucosamine-6-phosphate deacetylase
MTTTLLLNGTIVASSLKREGYALLIDDEGKIGEIFPMEHLPYKSFPSTTRQIDVKGGYIAPGFIDTHLHGIGGYGTEDHESASILGMSERLADFGVTAFFPTIYTDTRSNMIALPGQLPQPLGKRRGLRS